MVLLASFGLAPLSEDESRIAFRNRKGIAAFRVLRGFGLSGQAAKDMNRRQARRTFQAGGIGVFVTMSSVLRSFSSVPNPQPILIKPLPLEATTGRIPAAGPVGLVMARDPVSQEKALDFLRFAASEGQRILIDTSGYLPANPHLVRNEASPFEFANPEKIIDWYSFPGNNSSKLANYIKDVMQQVVTL